MNGLLWSTGWGALYLCVLLALMVPTLFIEAKRWLALYMVLLFVADRGAVGLISQWDNATTLFFLAWAYFMVTVGVILTHRAILMGVMLIVTSLALTFSGFGLISWDLAGVVQEVCGYIAMLWIFFGRAGTHRHVKVDDPADRSGPDRFGSAAPARRQAHK